MQALHALRTGDNPKLSRRKLTFDRCRLHERYGLARRDTTFNGAAAFKP
jgi:hypothetical protein